MREIITSITAPVGTVAGVYTYPINHTIHFMIGTEAVVVYSPVQNCTISQMMATLTITVGETAVELLDELIPVFLENTERLLNAGYTAIENQDLRQLGEIMHTLKGSSASMGLHQLASLCLKAETAANNGHFDEAARMFYQMESKYEQIEEELHEYRQ